MRGHFASDEKGLHRRLDRSFNVIAGGFIYHGHHAMVEGRSDHVLTTMGEPVAVQVEAVTASGDRCGVTHNETSERGTRRPRVTMIRLRKPSQQRRPARRRGEHYPPCRPWWR